MTVPEAKLSATKYGLVPKGEGWFVLNAREAQWWDRKGRGLLCQFEGSGVKDALDFTQLGINVSVLGPGEPMAMYHYESDQEDFLVLEGDALLICEGEEWRLRQWDFVHCPARTEHVIIGAGDSGCILLAVGARDRSTGPAWGSYTVDQAAIRQGAGVEFETMEPKEAYVNFEASERTAYREGTLPDL